MKSNFKAPGKGAQFLPSGMVGGRDTKRSVLLGHSRMAIACFAMYAIMALTPAATLADRGRGSIRAAARPAPAPQQRPRFTSSRPMPRRTFVPSFLPMFRFGRRHASICRVVATGTTNDEDTGHGGGFARAPVRAIRGQRVHDIPHHVSIFFNNQNYFYDDDGNYYQQENGDYLVVQPPVGAIVAALPPGVTTIVAGSTTYYYLDGVFYVAQDNSFAVVNPPPGIVVPDPPSAPIKSSLMETSITNSMASTTSRPFRMA